MWNETPQQLSTHLYDHRLRRAFIVRDPNSGKLEASHPTVEALAQELTRCADFHRHEACFFEVGQQSGHLLSTFVHDTTRGQAAGGVRSWHYPRLSDLVRDGLRLSRAMGQKCAVAGLWWGGGKGVIARQQGVDYRDERVRAAIYRDFGRMMSDLCGCYVTAEDVGTRPQDMARVFTTTRHTTCIPEDYGGSGNPSVLTARGVVVAMEAALAFGQAGDLRGKIVAMQGLGNVSEGMIAQLLERSVARVVGADIDEGRVDQMRRRFSEPRVELRLVAPDDANILAEPCDILAPNAIGATLNPQTIPHVQAAIICGGANNQLEDVERDAQALSSRGIVFVPDFVANRMGIVNCANEQYGWFEGDPAIASHLDHATPHGIFQRCQQVLRSAAATGRTTVQEAEALADALAQQPHPLWPGRGQQIIRHLVESGWAEG